MGLRSQGRLQAAANPTVLWAVPHRREAREVLHPRRQRPQRPGLNRQAEGRLWASPADSDADTCRAGGISIIIEPWQDFPGANIHTTSNIAFGQDSPKTSPL